jgi:hypothetical protein
MATAIDWAALFAEDTEEPAGASTSRSQHMRGPRERHDADITQAMADAVRESWSRGGADGSRGKIPHGGARKDQSGDDEGASPHDGAGGGDEDDGLSEAEAREFDGPEQPWERVQVVPGPAARPGFVSAAQDQIDRALAGPANESSSSEAENDGSGADTGPRRIPLASKYAHSVQTGYRARPYDDVPTEGSESASTDESNDGEDDEQPREGRRSRTLHRDECFLCAWGDRFHDGIEAPAVNRLNSIIDLNYGLVDNRAIAQMVHIYFKKNVYDPRTGMAMLTQETVLEHIEQFHSLDPRIMLGELIRKYMHLIAVLQNEIFYANGNFGRFQFAALNQATRMLLTLYKSDPVKMNFYDARRELNTKLMGMLMNVRTAFTQRGHTAEAKRIRRKRRELESVRKGLDAPGAAPATPTGTGKRGRGGGMKRARDGDSGDPRRAVEERTYEKRPRIEF